jgi:hypothetical protein
MTLERRLQRKLREWMRMATAFRLAQNERDPSEDEWFLNKAEADMIERLANELADELARVSTPAVDSLP